MGKEVYVNRLTICARMESSFWFDTINLGWSIVFIEGSEDKFYIKNIVFLSLKIVFVLTNSVYPDEMLHYYVAIHQGIHCLPKYAFRSQ